MGAKSSKNLDTNGQVVNNINESTGSSENTILLYIIIFMEICQILYKIYRLHRRTLKRTVLSKHDSRPKRNYERYACSSSRYTLQYWRTQRNQIPCEPRTLNVRISDPAVRPASTIA